MYQWIVLAHVLAAFGFVLSHGTSTFVALKLRRERNPERLKALLELSSASTASMFLFFLVMLVAGIWAAFEGHWWGETWLWTALGVLIFITTVMSAFGTEFYDKVRRALLLPEVHAGDKKMRSEPTSSEELDVLLNSTRPIVLMAIGGLGLGVIIWLMMIKPF